MYATRAAPRDCKSSTRDVTAGSVTDFRPCMMISRPLFANLCAVCFPIPSVAPDMRTLRGRGMLNAVQKRNMQNSSRSFIALDVSKIILNSYDGDGREMRAVWVDCGFFDLQRKRQKAKRERLMNILLGYTSLERACYHRVQACGAAFNEKTPAYLLLPACLEMRLVSADCFSNGFGQQC